MKKYISILIVSIITIIVVFVVVNNPKEMVIIKERDSIQSFYINGTNYDDEAVVNNIIDILEQYDTEKTNNPFPMESSKMQFEINYNDNHNPRHIILGKINVIYESGDKSVYKILNGDKLLLEIENYFNR